MRTIETINDELAHLKTELLNVKGTRTEVYTRIVGYYRSIKNWNKGKREEYNYRVPFSSLVREETDSCGKSEGTHESSSYDETTARETAIA